MVELDVIHQGEALAHIARLPAGSLDLILADPPYGDGAKAVYGLTRKRGIAGNASPLLGLYAIEQALAKLKDNRFCLCFLGQRHVSLIDQYLRLYPPANLRGYIVWDKQIMGLGYGVRSCHELIAVLEKGKPVYADRGIPSIISHRRSDYRHHPNEKPVPLMRWLIERFSALDDVVFDPFAGCGTTCLAARLTGRRFIGVELEARYATIARSRLAEARQ